MSGFGILARFTYDNLFGGYVTNGKWSKQKYDEYMVARSILPLYSAYADYQIGQAQNDWYMDRYNLDWSDVTQPWNLPGQAKQEASVRHGINFVSDNIKRLYK